MRPLPPRGRTDGGLQTAMRITGRLKGVFLLGTSIVLTIASLLIAPLIRGILAEQSIEPAGVVALYLGMPWITTVLSLPAFAGCVLLVRGTRRPILWMTISTLLLLPPLGFFLFGALGGIAAVYEKALSF